MRECLHCQLAIVCIDYFEKYKGEIAPEEMLNVLLSSMASILGDTLVDYLDEEIHESLCLLVTKVFERVDMFRNRNVTEDSHVVTRLN